MNTATSSQATLAALADRLRRGHPIRDAELERLYPELARQGSPHFWTPVDVARRAAELLCDGGEARVLDIGAGIGKFCVVGALTTPGTFTGIEHRAHLVELGRRVIDCLQVSRARLVHGTLHDIAWTDFDAFYLFNPFEENLYDEAEQLDQTVVLSEARFYRDVALVEAALDRAPVGTRLVTYHGFGGRIPFAYDLARAERRGGSALRLWVKARSESSLHEGHLEALLPLPGGPP